MVAKVSGTDDSALSMGCVGAGDRSSFVVVFIVAVGSLVLPYICLELAHIPDDHALIQLKSGIHGSSEHVNYLKFPAKVRLRKWELSSLK